MKRPSLVAAVLGLLLCVCASSFAATNSVLTTAPSLTRFDLCWGARPGLQSCTVKWDGKKLTCEFCFHGKRERAEIVPTKVAWEKFWTAMDKVRVWEWKSRYDNYHVLDGLVWSLQIDRGDHRVDSGGRNGYPAFGEPGADNEEPSPEFTQYQKAVEDLIGRRLWRE